MARKLASPSSVPYEAQLATLVDEPPEGDGWLHEQKFDGYRIGLIKDGDTVVLRSRRNLDWTAQFSSVAAAGGKLRAGRALLDGEVAVVLPNGVTSFQGLQNRASGSALVYFAFDLLQLDDRDLRPLPIEERKRELQALLERGPPSTIRYSDHVIGQGKAFFAQAEKLGLEGIVSKLLGGPYRSGRNTDWLKTKCLHRQEFVVGGFTEPERSREGLGALVLGVYEAGRLRWAGQVGTGLGWNGKFLRELRRRLEELVTPSSPFDPPVSDSKTRRTAVWVKPELVVEVAFSEWTKDGRVRHPSMQGIREDKRATDVVHEKPAVRRK